LVIGYVSPINYLRFHEDKRYLIAQGFKDTPSVPQRKLQLTAAD
jgi:hypothetical protein